MRLIKTPTMTIQPMVRVAMINTTYQPNTSLSVGTYLTVFNGWMNNQNETSAIIINSSTLRLPQGSKWLINVTLIIHSLNGTGYRWISVRAYNGSNLIYTAGDSDQLLCACGHTDNFPYVKELPIDTTNGPVDLRFRIEQVSAGVTTGAIDNWTAITVKQIV